MGLLVLLLLLISVDFGWSLWDLVFPAEFECLWYLGYAVCFVCFASVGSASVDLRTWYGGFSDFRLISRFTGFGVLTDLVFFAGFCGFLLLGFLVPWRGVLIWA